MLNSDHINYFFFSCNLILPFTEGCISGLYLWIGVLMMWRHYSKTCGVWEDFEKQFWKKQKPQSLSLYMLTEVKFHLRISTHCQRILEGTNSFTKWTMTLKILVVFIKQENCQPLIAVYFAILKDYKFQIRKSENVCLM